MTIESMLCDSAIHRFVTDGASVAVDVGRSTLNGEPPFFAALTLRDQGCRFPGCDRPVSQCEAHHVTPWQHGGSTDRDNLVLLRLSHQS